MTLKTIDLDKTHLTLEELLAEIDSHTELILTRGAAPIARVTAAAKPVDATARRLGLNEGQGWISDDFTDELPDSFWLGDGE
jgi:antitoxin (DNA-binding transcriptional repressor) of toxin-antitoxin stability system